MVGEWAFPRTASLPILTALPDASSWGDVGCWREGFQRGIAIGKVFDTHEAPAYRKRRLAAASLTRIGGRGGGEVDPTFTLRKESFAKG